MDVTQPLPEYQGLTLEENREIALDARHIPLPLIRETTGLPEVTLFRFCPFFGPNCNVAAHIASDKITFNGREYLVQQAFFSAQDFQLEAWCSDSGTFELSPGAAW